MGRMRKNHSAEEKAAILREHLIERTPVSELCDKHGIHPTVFYRRQKRMFENLPELFRSGHGVKDSTLTMKNEALKEKPAQKDMVIAEIMEDFIKVKKDAWGRLIGAWVSPSVRDDVVDFTHRYSELTGLAVSRLIEWIGCGRDKLYQWRRRYRKDNNHNAPIPRDFLARGLGKRHHNYLLSRTSR